MPKLRTTAGLLCGFLVSGVASADWTGKGTFGEIGLGVRQTELRLTGEKPEDGIVRGAMNFEHKLTDTTLVYDRPSATTPTCCRARKKPTRSLP